MEKWERKKNSSLLLTQKTVLTSKGLHHFAAVDLHTSFDVNQRLVEQMMATTSSWELQGFAATAWPWFNSGLSHPTGEAQPTWHQAEKGIYSKGWIRCATEWCDKAAERNSKRKAPECKDKSPDEQKHRLICTKNKHSQCRRVSDEAASQAGAPEICWHELGHLSREETWRWLSVGHSEDWAVRRGRPPVPAPRPLAELLLPGTDPYPVIRLIVAFQSTAEHPCT